MSSFFFSCINHNNFLDLESPNPLKPLTRNHSLYELVVYHGKKKLFRFIDSLNLLPSSLANLAKNLCPDLGSKGSIRYEDVTLPNPVNMTC